jgi:putative ATP-binding cassette transporter
MAAILNTIPNLASARVSLQNMQQVLSKLSEEQDGDDINPLEHWRTMRLAGVSYHYSTVDGRIEIGPVDLELARGEITFLVGGNGSGKSSLCKLISLHYSPDAGEIYVGKTRVDPLSRNSCRQAIAAVMTDYYLFDRLLMDMNPETERLVQQLLIELGLAHVLSIEGGRFSRTALSDGQRKRLALLCALLEDRDLYVFDEWADNQDPSFKNIFYLQILPALRARNKAIVVVSHDDRYFNVADQLIVMEGGKCIRKERCVPRDGRQSPQPGATAIVVGAGWRQPAAHSVSKLP